MRASEVNRLLGQVDTEAENSAMLLVPFILGETVKVVSGPFSTFDATIEKINEEKQKLEVTVKIFGRKTPVELGFTEVEKL
jgi:transcriptional antiterminator NusG